MRRMTIYRSKRAALLALVAVPLVGSVLAAQDTTQAQPAAQAPPAGPLPATHTVARGETLWSIAQLYFGDPLLWPEIYRRNTAVVEDPHWIYPGEVLALAPAVGVAQAPAETTAVSVAQVTAADTVRAQANPADTVAAVAAPVDTGVVDTAQAAVEEPPAAPAAESYETIFERHLSRTEEVRNVLRAYANQPYRPLRRGEFYSAGFLTEREKFPWAKVLGTTAKPAIPRLSERSTANEFEEIAIDPPSHASYHVGDSLLLARLDRQIANWGTVVVPVGIARVTAIQKKQVLADVVAQFGRIHDGHLAIPLEPFKDPGAARPTPVDQGLEGQLVGARDVHTIAGAQQVFFIDKGRVDGVVPGDVFEVYRPATGEPGSASEEVRMILMVVHTREHSSSGLVLGLANPQVYAGMPVRLIKKMPS